MNVRTPQSKASANLDISGFPQGALFGAVQKTLHSSNIAGAITTILTAPTDKKVLVQFITVSNPTSGAITYTLSILAGGVTRRIGTAAVSIAANANGGPAQCFVLEPGEALRITPSAIGLAVIANYLELPANSGFKSPRLTSFSVGDNTLYEVPTSKQAYVLAFSNTTGPNMLDTKSLQYTNDCGGAVVPKVAYVPTGATISDALHGLNGAGASVADAGQSLIDRLPWLMNGGDKIVVDVDVATAGQFAGMTVYEVDLY